jgi:biotin carboxyl carrier protein
MTTRRLLQVHPPGPETRDTTAANDTPDFEIAASSPGRWEGTVRLDDGRTAPFLAYRDGQRVHVWIAGETYVFAPPAPTTRSRRPGQAASDDIVCPVPGVVIAVHVSAGHIVEAGQDLVIIESMKTEQLVKSPRAGTVERVSVQEGDRVDRGMRLVVLVPEDGAGQYQTE